MLYPRNAPKTNPYAAAGVVPRSERDKDAPFGAGGQRHGRRVERGTTDDGRPLFTVVLPTPHLSKTEDAIDLDQWTEFPRLAEPVAHALLDLFRTRKSPHSRRTLTGELSHFARFLAETVEVEKRGGFTLKDLDTPLVGEYINWLNRTDPKTGTAALAVGTRRRCLGALRNAVEALKRGRWAADASKTLQVRNHVWSGLARQSESVEIIPRDEFGRLYRACLGEVVEIRAAVEGGRRLIEAARDRVPMGGACGHVRGPGRPPSRDPTAAAGVETYDDLGLRLAAINAAWVGLLPEKEDALDTHRALMNAVMRHGGLAKHARYFYPSSRDLVPFVVLLAVHTAYNPDTILGCTHDDISFEPGVGAARVVVEPSLANVDGDPAAERVKAKAFKGRARAKQPRSFPVTADPDNPAELLAFLERWTDRIRPHVPPRYANRVFVFGTHRRARAATSYVNERGTLSNTVWKHSLKKFCRKHGLREFTLRQIRQTVIDLAHELSGGDLRAVLAVGGQRSADTINSHYTSSGARERNYEGLAAAGALMWRDRMAGGRADARRAAEIGGDVGAATPGWGCLDPYDSPVPGQRPGRACEAYGRCPGCPLAQLNTASLVSCAQAHDLLARIDEARETIGPLHWMEKWGPLRKRLTEYWLPRFPEDVRDKARLFGMRRLPPVE